MSLIMTALLFYIIGRLSGHEQTLYKRVTTTLQKQHMKPLTSTEVHNLSIDTIIEQTKQRTTVTPGTLPLKTPEDFEDERSGDTALEKRWREAGMAEEIRQ